MRARIAAVAFTVGAVGLGCGHPSASPQASPEAAAPVVREPPPPTPPACSDGGCPGASQADAAVDAAALSSGVTAKHYRLVVHTGDSMVGGGLCKALTPKFQADGTKFVRDVWEAASLPMFADSDRVPKLMKKYDPDLVLVTLGANDLLTMHPEVFAKNVESIVKKIGNRDCVWIGPPPWKGEHGLIDVMREHASPCRFFDSSPLVLERRPDGIHPTEKGGEVWAGAVWSFLKGAESGT